LSKERENLVLDLLRAIRGDTADLHTDMIEVKERIGLVEGQCSSISRRIDRVAGDVEQIKRRLILLEV